MCVTRLNARQRVRRGRGRRPTVCDDTLYMEAPAFALAPVVVMVREAPPVEGVEANGEVEPRNTFGQVTILRCELVWQMDGRTG